jgi:hypothetical protein
MVQWVTGTLLSENLLAALLLGALAAMRRYGETGERRFLHAAALMAGAAMSTKLGAITLVAVALPFAVIEVRRRPKTRRAWLAAVILLALAVPPYAIAWAKTGNPLFPFLNERFHSPLLPPNTRITEQRYHEPLKWNTAYHLTFHTHSYSEGRDGELGFQYLLLAPLALMALFADRSRQVAAAAVIAVVSSLLILGTQPIARYLYAGLPLFYIPAAALLAWAGAHHRVLFRVLVAVCAACIVLNTCVLSAQGYYYSFYPPFTQVQRLSWLRHSGPERLMIDEYNRRHAGEAALQVQDSFHAGLQAEVYENHWHQAATRDALRGAETPGEVHRLLDRWRVRNAIGRVPKAGEHVYPPALERFLDDCALPELIVDDLLLSHLEPGCSGPAIPRESPRPRIPARPGIYDDISPYIVYRGGWQHDDIFPEAFRGTVSYHDLSGAVAVLSLEGSEVMWVYTAAPNRGIATVTIDGVDRGTVDQYASSIHWQQRHQLRMGDSGPHLLVIRVTGRSRPEAAGSFIDVDSFEVKP